MFTIAAADNVQRDRINARIDERQTKPHDAEIMPEVIIRIVRVWIEMKPNGENMVWKETYCKKYYQRQDHFHHFSP